MCFLEESWFQKRGFVLRRVLSFMIFYNIINYSYKITIHHRYNYSHLHLIRKGIVMVFAGLNLLRSKNLATRTRGRGRARRINVRTARKALHARNCPAQGYIPSAVIYSIWRCIIILRTGVTFNEGSCGVIKCSSCTIFNVCIRSGIFNTCIILARNYNIFFFFSDSEME